jgi:hypothetical protein
VDVKAAAVHGVASGEVEGDRGDEDEQHQADENRRFPAPDPEG